MKSSISMSELAEATGYHKSTVSRALRNDPSIPEKTRNHIQSFAEKLGYRPHPYLSSVMTLTRSRQPQRNIGETLVWITESREGIKSWTSLPFLAPYFRGAARRADELGRKLEMIAPDEFLNRKDSQNPVEDYAAMLKARGIPGILLPELEERKLLDYPWNDFSVVSINPADPYTDTVTSNPHPKPRFNRVTADRYHNMLDLIHFLHDLGYRRMGLLSNHWSEDWQSGMARAACLLVSGDLTEPVPVMYQPPEEEDPEPFYKEFSEWIDKYKVDVVIAGHAGAKDWLEAIGLSVPGDIGLVHQNLGKDVPGWSGVDVNMERIGELAIEILSASVQRNECGPVDYPILIYVRGTVVEGETTRRQK